MPIDKMRAHLHRARNGQALHSTVDTQLVAPWVRPSTAPAGNETRRKAERWVRALRRSARGRAVATAAPPSAPTTDLKEVSAWLGLQACRNAAAGAELTLTQYGVYVLVADLGGAV